MNSLFCAQFLEFPIIFIISINIITEVFSRRVSIYLFCAIIEIFQMTVGMKCSSALNQPFLRERKKNLPLMRLDGAAGLLPSNFNCLSWRFPIETTTLVFICIFIRSNKFQAMIAITIKLHLRCGIWQIPFSETVTSMVLSRCICINPDLCWHQLHGS